MPAGTKKDSFWHIYASFSHPSSSSSLSLDSTASLHNPSPFTILVSLISISYYWRAITQLPLLSPTSFCTNRDLTFKWGTITLVFDLRRYGWKCFTTLKNVKAWFSIWWEINFMPCKPKLMKGTGTSSPCALF